MVEQYTDKFGTSYRPVLTSMPSFGLYNKNKQYKTGDVVIENGKVYVYSNGSFMRMDSYEEDNKVFTTNKCPNCGAPLKPGETKCSYCDSWFSVMKV